MSNSKMYEDVSIFQGIREFNTPDGMLQFHSQGGGIWHVYTEGEDGRSWIFDGAISASRRGNSNTYLYSQWEKQSANCY